MIFRGYKDELVIHLTPEEAVGIAVDRRTGEVILPRDVSANMVLDDLGRAMRQLKKAEGPAPETVKVFAQRVSRETWVGAHSAFVAGAKASLTNAGCGYGAKSGLRHAWARGLDAALAHIKSGGILILSPEGYDRAYPGRLPGAST